MSDKEGCLWWIAGIVMFFVVITAYGLISEATEPLSSRELEATAAAADPRSKGTFVPVYDPTGSHAEYLDGYGDYLDDKAAVVGATRVAERRIESAEQRISDLEQQVRDLDPCAGWLTCP